MSLKHQTINEERGARRAAELRRRFRRVSNASSRRHFGVWSVPGTDKLTGMKAKSSGVNDFMVWCAFGVALAFIGFVIF